MENKRHSPLQPEHKRVGRHLNKLDHHHKAMDTRHIPHRPEVRIDRLDRRNQDGRRHAKWVDIRNRPVDPRRIACAQVDRRIVAERRTARSPGPCSSARAERARARRTRARRPRRRRPTRREMRRSAWPRPAVGARGVGARAVARRGGSGRPWRRGVGGGRRRRVRDGVAGLGWGLGAEIGMAVGEAVWEWSWCDGDGDEEGIGMGLDEARGCAVGSVGNNDRSGGKRREAESWEFGRRTMARSARNNSRWR